MSPRFEIPRSTFLSAARVLPGNQADIGGKVVSVLEAKGIAHQREENRGRQNAHAGNGQTPLADRVCLGKLSNPAIKVFPFLVGSGELISHFQKLFCVKDEKNHGIHFSPRKSRKNQITRSLLS